MGDDGAGLGALGVARDIQQGLRGAMQPIRQADGRQEKGSACQEQNTAGVGDKKRLTPPLMITCRLRCRPTSTWVGMGVDKKNRRRAKGAEEVDSDVHGQSPMAPLHKGDTKRAHVPLSASFPSLPLSPALFFFLCTSIHQIYLKDLGRPTLF